jgi:hypothetical protein
MKLPSLRNLDMPNARWKPPARSQNPRALLSAQQRRAVLRWIAEHRSTAWIVAELERRYGIERNAAYLDNTFRWSARYKAQIAQYRQEYNAQFKDEGFASRRFTLQALKQAYDVALADRDAKAMVACIKQACALMGHHALSDLEMATGDSRYGSFEDMLAILSAAAPASLALVESQPLPSPVEITCRQTGMTPSTASPPPL